MDKIYFQWHITDACNFRCRHCYQDDFGPDRELDLQALKLLSQRIFQTARQQSKKVIFNITGGEPFLKKDLFELLAYLDAQPEVFELAIITNGSLINQGVIKELRSIKKINQIKISLDGADAPSNDYIRGEGSFERTIKAIKLLRRYSSFSINLMLTVMKSNLDQVPGVFELCRALQVNGLIIERFLPLGRGEQMINQLLGYRDWLSLVSTVFKLTGRDYRIEDIVSFRAFWIKISKKQNRLLGASCNVSKNAFCLMPDGSVFPCRRFNLKLGNLLQDSLSDILNSEILYRIINAKKKGRCHDCEIQDCRGCAALSYILSDDFLSEDAQCFYKRDLVLNYSNSKQEA